MDGVQQPGCAAAPYLRYVDEAINKDARREYEEATSELQPEGADLGEGSAYVSEVETPITFDVVSSACTMCEGRAALLPNGSVAAPRCPVSGTCEVEWARANPQNYIKEDGSLMANQLPCRVELGCKALIGFKKTSDGFEPFIEYGECRVDTQGRDWVARYHQAVGKIKVIDPEKIGVEKFDGEGSGREDEEEIDPEDDGYDSRQEPKRRAV